MTVMSKRPFVGGVGINGWLLLAQVIDAPGPRWSPEWSDALDATILMLRKEAQRLPADPNKRGGHKHKARVQAEPRRPEDQYRRDVAAARLAGKPPPPVPPQRARTEAGSGRQPTPVLMPNGRWLIRFKHNGKPQRGWFDTEQEAIDWAQQVKAS